MSKPKPLATIRPRRVAPVLVCKKCLKRVDDGKQVKKALASGLKQAAARAGVKRGKVVLTSCFGICPKHAVVVASGATLQHGEFLLVGDADGAEQAVAQLVGETAVERV